MPLPLRIRGQRPVYGPSERDTFPFSTLVKDGEHLILVNKIWVYASP